MAQYKKNIPVPSGRLSRLSRFGGLAGSLVGGMVSEGINHIRQGKVPTMPNLMMTPGNIQKIADQLSILRGAAMKIGQLLSIDSGDLLPEELSQILNLLRSDAHPIPLSQIASILEENWGDSWQDNFRQFSFYPIAAASIGQVHRAETKAGESLAIKIQYPGVSDSIESDINNVAMILKISGMLPQDMDISDILNEAKRQLKEETDYLKEAENLQRFNTLLADDDRFHVPEVITPLSSENILTMGYEDAKPLDFARTSSQETRNFIVGSLIDLLLRELFEFRLVQTDPNIANYLYQPEKNQIVLLDFGACRDYEPNMVNAYRSLLRCAIGEDHNGMIESAKDIGYFKESITTEQRNLIIQLFSMVVEPIRQGGIYDFGQSDLAARIREIGMELSFRKEYWHTPPVDALFFHRKLIGLYLLATRFNARIDVSSSMRPFIETN